jgi:ribosomal protein S18 acetylase RimI-like enzyme
MTQKRFNIAEVQLRDFRIEDYDALVALWQATGLGYKPKGRDRREKIAEELERGCGLAQLLITEAEKILHEDGLDILTCLVEAENVASQKLFEKMGYVRWDGLVYYSKRRYKYV